MEQPNVTHDGDTRLSPRFWLAVVLTGVAAGLFGDLLMWILALVERLAFNDHSGSYQHAVATSSDARRILSLALAGVFGAVSWFLIRRYLKNERAEIDEAIWSGDGDLSPRRSLLTSLVSEVVVGAGASIGREAAPKLMGGASGSVIAQWFGLTSAQKRLLVACGGGAGLACVYNVPLGGALFTAEVLYGSFALPVVFPALATSLIATLVAWIYLPHTATYADVPNYRFSASLMVWSLLAGVVVGALAVGYVRLIGWTSFHRAQGPRILWVMPLAFVALGVVGVWYPQLFGNGKDMAHEAFLGVGGIGLFFALFMLKPIVTTLTLGSGAAGGLFTPFLATGAMFGAFFGSAWVRLWPGTPVGAFALVGAAAMIGAAMQAPLAGLVLVLEAHPRWFQHQRADDLRDGDRHRDRATDRRVLDLLGPPPRARGPRPGVVRPGMRDWSGDSVPAPLRGGRDVARAPGDTARLGRVTRDSPGGAARVPRGLRLDVRECRGDHGAPVARPGGVASLLSGRTSGTSGGHGRGRLRRAVPRHALALLALRDVGRARHGGRRATRRGRRGVGARRRCHLLVPRRGGGRRPGASLLRESGLCPHGARVRDGA